MTQTSDTHNPQSSVIDAITFSSIGTQQYLLEKKSADAPNHPDTRPDNFLQLHVCGKEAFGRLAQDIRAMKAGDTLDLICWGFEPSMMLVRRDGRWNERESYGYLLEQAARRGAHVRLLVWFNVLGNLKQHNTPGYSGALTGFVNSSAPGNLIGNPSDGAQRESYCVQWWQRVKEKRTSGLSVRTRDGQAPAIQRALLDERYTPETKIWVDEKLLIERFGTHHQKTALFNYQAPNRGTGWVLGLNSTTDYWDSSEHLIEDDRREAAQGDERRAGYRTRKPLQDYAVRIDGGGALQALHANFALAWERAGGKADAALQQERLRPVGQVQVQSAPDDRPGTADTDLARELARAARTPARPSRAQILRTQPEESEKSIKAFYRHACDVAHDYLYLENQYFFYPEWAQDLKSARAKWVKDWQRKFRKTPNPAVAHLRPRDMPLLHVMVVIPEPEVAQMVPRTYETLRELGQESGMAVPERDERGEVRLDPVTGKPVLRGQHVLVTDREDREAAFVRDMADYRRRAAKGEIPAQHQPSPPPEASAAVQEAMAITPTSALTMEEDFGLKVHTAMLYTSGIVRGQMRHRPIYIHSKLMIHSDACFTLGSANMNQRSMSGDSELNIASDCPDTTRELRERVFKMHSGGKVTGGTGQAQAVKAFDDWSTLAARNYVRRWSGEMLKGFLVTFEEGRTSEVRYG